jgi:protein TonB
MPSADEYSIPITRQDRKQPEVDQQIEERHEELKDIFVEVSNDTKVKIIDEPVDDGSQQLVEIPIFKEEPVIEVDIYALEKMPVFPGCEDLLDEEARYNCFVQQVSKHVVSNFKPCEGAWGISKERLYIQFTVDEKGNVTAAKAIRGSDECNVDRALWVVNDLPKMKPGEYRGQTVRTRFVLPINIK